MLRWLLLVPEATVLRKHFEAVAIDQQEGLIAGTDTIGREIIGGPLMTLEEFVNANRKAFELHYRYGNSATFELTIPGKRSSAFVPLPRRRRSVQVCSSSARLPSTR